jgi:drug/metabolite transporter (DMT)-like permease
MKVTSITTTTLALLATGAHSFAPTRPLSFQSTVTGRISSSSSSLFSSPYDVDGSKTSTTTNGATIDATPETSNIVEMDVAADMINGKEGDDLSDDEYKKGFAIIGLITLFNASLAPVWHVVFEGNAPPPLFLNAVVSVIALLGLLAGGPFLDKSVDSMSSLADNGEEKWGKKSFRGGMELGFWKGLGTTCHIFGMSLTSANHGAFFLQLTTLIVPIFQGIMGEKIPRQIQVAVGLALLGIYAFTLDPVGGLDINPEDMFRGDLLCVAAAVFYSVYDIKTFYWGREVPRTELVTIKIGFQAILSCLLCAVVARGDVMDYINSGPDLGVFIPAALWSGLIVNALATFLQVGGMQAVGPTRAQTIFASQPLWASILNYVFIGEVMGLYGFGGGAAFLAALVLAATAEAPKPVLKEATEES